MWTELLDMTDDELDSLCALAQEGVDLLLPCVEREILEDLADACALILEERGVIPILEPEIV